MEPQELQEHAEHAHHSGEKALGLTTAIVAVLLALVTLLSRQAQTDEMLTLTQNVDDWNFYQAKHIRAYIFGLAAETEALLGNGRDAAIKNFQNSIEEECGAPIPKGCTSPILKKSSVMQALIKESKAEAGEKAEARETAGAATAEPAKGKSEEKQEKTAKEGGKEGAVEIQDKAKEGQAEVKLLEQKVNRYDIAELFLEISIVLCSIALLAENKLYWKLSFISTAIGIVGAVWGLLLR